MGELIGAQFHRATFQKSKFQNTSCHPVTWCSRARERRREKVFSFLRLIIRDAAVAIALSFASLVAFSGVYYAPDTFRGVLYLALHIAFALSVIYLLQLPAMIKWLYHEHKAFKEGHEYDDDPFLQGALEKAIAGALSVFFYVLIIIPATLICFLFAFASFAVVGVELWNSFFISHYRFDTTDVSLALILTISFTAFIPRLLNILLLLFFFILRACSRPVHAAVSHVLLRLAETKPGILPLLVVILTAFLALLSSLLKR